MSDRAVAVALALLALSAVLLVQGLRGQAWARWPAWHGAYLAGAVLLLIEAS